MRIRDTASGVRLWSAVGVLACLLGSLAWPAAARAELRTQSLEYKQDDAILGSVGFARTGVEVAVVDAEGKPAAAGEIGEIVCRGDVVMSGYWNNPGGTAEALRNGWLYTGDMGSFDDRGYLTLRDRSKDVVISGGSNIYPREVEEALLTHASVAEVCVVGAPDEEWGEVVVAFVVRVPGPAVAPEALDRHCLDRIARFKRPKRYVFVESLPKNSYGKVLKRELRQALSGATGASTRLQGSQGSSALTN